MNKRFLAVLAVLSIIFALSSCGKSEEIQQVDDLIMGIGIVTRGSEQAIMDAENAVNALTEREQKKLDNITVLNEARSEYNKILINDVMAAINAVGTVTLSSGEDIDSARNAYNNLTSELQSQVENYTELVNAEETLTKLKIDVVKTAIVAIGNVTIYSGDEIQTARQAYEDLDASLQPLVSNYSDLQDAEVAFFYAQVEHVEKAINLCENVTIYSGITLESAREKYDSAPDEIKAAVGNYEVLVSAERTFIELRAKNVEELIDTIGTVTLDNESKITTARNEYNNLTSDEKALVKNVSTLTAAENKLVSLRKEEAKRVYTDAMSRMKSERDKVESTTWYESESQPEYINTRSYIFPYIGESGNLVWLRLKFNYTGDNWLFYEKITVWIDGICYYPDFDYDDVKRDNGHGDVWEVLDISPSENDIDMLWEIVNSKETIIRFEGEERLYDLTVKSSDKQGIKDVLNAFNYMTNN